MITPLQRQILSRFRTDYLTRLYSDIDLRTRFHKNLRTRLGVETKEQFKDLIIDELEKRKVITYHD